MLPALTVAETRAYRDTIRGVHERRIRAALLDRAGNTVANLTQVIDGQVIVDANQDVTRQTTLQILDINRALGFDADTYQGQELQLSRMLRVFWVVNGPLLSRPISVPVHTGPLLRLRRDGPTVTIEAQGKEAYGLTQSRKTLTIKKGARRTDAIKTILRERMGETRLGAIPDLPAKLADDFTVSPKHQPWKRALKLAASLDRQLFYGADGVPYLRKPVERVTWQFKADDPYGGDITAPVSVTADLQAVKNHIIVTGATPKGKKKPVTAEATADRLHPLSPWVLGAGDAPLWLVEEINNPDLRTAAECQAVAKKRLARGLRLVHEASFNAVPVPHLEPLDLIQAVTAYETSTTQLETFTLPIGISGDMTVGYVDPYRLKKVRKWEAAR